MGSVPTDRLLLVSNRLPVTVRLERGRSTSRSSAGGLATGLRRRTPTTDGLWIGVAGRRVPPHPAQRRRSIGELAERPAGPGPPQRRPRSTGTTRASRTASLWPLFHYLLDRLPLEPPRLGDATARSTSASPTPSREPWPPGRHGLGARLPAHARARRCCASGCPTRASGSSSTSRSRRRRFPDPPVARGDPRRAARRRPLGFHTLAVRCALRRLAAARARRDADAVGLDRTAGATCGSARSRWAIDAATSRALAGRRGADERAARELRRRRRPRPARRRPARLHEGHPAPPARVRAAAGARPALRGRCG